MMLQQRAFLLCLLAFLFLSFLVSLGFLLVSVTQCLDCLQKLALPDAQTHNSMPRHTTVCNNAVVEG